MNIIIGDNSIKKDTCAFCLTCLICSIGILSSYDSRLSFSRVFIKIIPPSRELIIVGNIAINIPMPVPQLSFLHLKIALKKSNKIRIAHARLTTPQIRKNIKSPFNSFVLGESIPGSFCSCPCSLCWKSF